MTSHSPTGSSEGVEKFGEAAMEWDLDRLYADLTQVKQELMAGTRQKILTPTEKTHLRGLLCHKSQQEIARELYVEANGLRVAWCNGLYRYVETLTKRPEKTITHYSDISRWLEEAGYKRDRNQPPAMPTRIQYWVEAPEISMFYGRTDELATLKGWLIESRCRIVALSGLGGIGKTALAANLASQIQDQFDGMIWRSLGSRPPVNRLVDQWIQLLDPTVTLNSRESTDDKISRLVDYLGQHRCLLVLDGLEAMMREGDRMGQYGEGYEEYGQLFQSLGTVGHKSCLLLTTREIPTDIERLQMNHQSVQSYRLMGLRTQAAREWFQDLGLGDPQKWDALIREYGGNPLALKIVVSRIFEFFKGSVSSFFSLDTILIGNLFKELLDEQFNRLSEPEKQIMYYLASQEGSVSIQQLQQEVNFSSNGDLINALTSLRGRSLIEESTSKGPDLMLQPLVKRYVVREYSGQCDRFKR